MAPLVAGISFRPCEGLLLQPLVQAGGDSFPNLVIWGMEGGGLDSVLKSELGVASIASEETACVGAGECGGSS